MMNNWAVIALGGIPNKVQVGDMGVDGRIVPVHLRDLSFRISRSACPQS